LSEKGTVMQHSFARHKNKEDSAFFLPLSLPRIYQLNESKLLSPFFPLCPSSLCVAGISFIFFHQTRSWGTEPILMTARNKLVFFYFSKFISQKLQHIHTYLQVKGEIPESIE
jgi:hypothetical protein